ncbi:DUF58 domain-containing protein [Microcella frigidaquae]|uniref:Uncharacterized protein (DUF58 family) n=1 Tax=Microcella frigidaquae TaxID=424758 RepID=A0A840XJB1_9MICO|nr:DUF58 domain-containing protein [Microcella frigidaquae]MBB5618552.1 uncharacterized protein (DUF58 family) [Microcella frigidaquae]NHN43988.1 DUF58 domain-containing protein [Microcella frigidaquae]
MALTGWFVLLVAVGAVPVVALSTVAPAGLVLLGWLTLCAVLAGLDLALAASPRALRLHRQTDARVRLTETARATLLITNPSRRVLRGRLRDAWEPSAGARPTRHAVLVPPGERRAVVTELTPWRRGERRALHVTVRARGPLRLAERQASIRLPGSITVLPEFAARKHLPSRLARLRELDGRTSVMVRGQGTEFDSLREYVRGDDVRSIDWRATARRSGEPGPGGRAGQTLMVRTWRPERDRHVVVIVDSGRTSAARIADETRIDTAFESTLLLAALADRAGDRVDVAVFDRRVRGRVQGARGAALLPKLVEMMAPVEPELIETDYTAVPSLVRSMTTQRSLVVLCVPLESPGATRSLLAMLPQLTTRHLVLVAAVTDPGVLEAAAVRDDRAAVYRAAAAERALLDAERVAAAVRRLGGDVVSAAPLDLPPAVADRYLAYKAAGRL